MSELINFNFNVKTKNKILSFTTKINSKPPDKNK